MANSIQAYASLAPTRRVYPGPSSSQSPSSSTTSSQQQSHSSTKTAHTSSFPRANVSPVTPLSARTFGTWTAITAIVRLYAAYHIEQQAMYELAIWTFGVAWAHFMSEWFIFKSTRWSKGLAGPVAVSTGSLLWMWTQWDYYVKK